MYEIIFYEDKNGNKPVLEYLQKLSRKNSKDSRINTKKINSYIEVLSQYGTLAGEPFIKHIDGEIWELRPLRNRIMFAGWYNGSFVLLHHFIKTTRKTPKREIEKAKQEFKDFIERNKHE